MDRWQAHLAKFRFREIPGLDAAAAWLRTHRPRHWEPGIIHGDYQFANVMFKHGAPAELAALVDFEMATVGDPLLDLGWVVMGWPNADEDRDAAGRYADYTGMPDRADIIEHYAKVSGRDVADIDYYVILARFKMAIVLEEATPAMCRATAATRRWPTTGTRSCRWRPRRPNWPRRHGYESGPMPCRRRAGGRRGDARPGR